MKPITDVLRQISGGRFVDEATDALAAAIIATTETGKPSEVTLKIKLKKAPRGTGALYVTNAVVTKLPKPEESATLMWPTPEGTLISEDPSQGKLDLKIATDAKTPTTLKDVPRAALVQ